MKSELYNIETCITLFVNKKQMDCINDRQKMPLTGFSLSDVSPELYILRNIIVLILSEVVAARLYPDLDRGQCFGEEMSESSF